MNIKSILRISVFEKGICFASLLMLTLIPFSDLVLKQFNLGIPGANHIVTHFFLVVGFFAAMLTSKSGEHISITATQYIKNVNVKQKIFLICSLITIFLLVIFAWNGAAFIKFGLAGRDVGILTDRIFAFVIPLGFTVIAIRFLLRMGSWRDKALGCAALLLGFIGALPAIAKLFWGFEPPEPFFSWVNQLYDGTASFLVPLILFLILAGLAGMPIFAVIGGIAIVMLQAMGREPEDATRQIYSALTDLDLVAIPLFTLTGFFLSESKAGERLVKTFRLLFGWLPGGIIIATVVICTFFTSFTGASGVTILALGGILFTILNENKYSEKFSLGLLTSVGGMGLMFPPSLPIILVASTSMTILHFMNIPIHFTPVDFFIAALIPGLILLITTVIASLVLSRKVKITRDVFNFKEALSCLKDSIFEILMPVILIGGYFSGFFTLVEASAVSVIYVIIVEVFIKKDIPVKNISKVFSKAVPIMGGVLAILAVAKALSFAFIDSGVPERFTFWMQSAVSSKYVFLLLLNFGLLILGCLMDIFSAILVFLPLIVPLGIAYGIDPIHLGIIFIVNLEAGFLTPPVGMNLFLASYRFERPFMKICGYVAPFLVVRLAVVLLVTYIPWFTSFLVGLFNK